MCFGVGACLSSVRDTHRSCMSISIPPFTTRFIRGHQVKDINEEVETVIVVVPKRSEVRGKREEKEEKEPLIKLVPCKSDKEALFLDFGKKHIVRIHLEDLESVILILNTTANRTEKFHHNLRYLQGVQKAIFETDPDGLLRMLEKLRI